MEDSDRNEIEHEFNMELRSCSGEIGDLEDFWRQIEDNIAVRQERIKTLESMKHGDPVAWAQHIDRLATDVTEHLTPTPAYYGIYGIQIDRSSIPCPTLEAIEVRDVLARVLETHLRRCDYEEATWRVIQGRKENPEDFERWVERL